MEWYTKVGNYLRIERLFVTSGPARKRAKIGVENTMYEQYALNTRVCLIPGFGTYALDIGP